MNKLVLGIDGGGTKVLARIADETGATLGEGASGACSISAMPVAEAFASARAACEAALAGRSASEVTAVCACVAGFSVVENRYAFQALLAEWFSHAHVIVEGDFVAAFTGATAGAPGIIVIAGTGQVAYGENGAASHKAGGYGYLIDDSGSGYGVGRAALAAVLKAADGLGERTILTERIQDVVGLGAPEIIAAVYGGALDRVRIASLSKVVADAANDDGDHVSQRILMQAGGALAQIAEAVSRKIFTADDPPFPIVPIGSLWRAGDYLKNVFVRSAHRFAPQATIIEPLEPPVQGAVLRALRL
ncbi:N-acetylmuramic acid/N-acetylglucosamine kinase [Capsulimonas corticalis]|uniref:N-acetylmuramic acid/N-acetylglucosamine kinase n=1 Tax=Capsulimonas corticalis TaxID=2219043 RepID=A0A402CYR0_9BACT|nr:BadF/BadG/BcrA/BcrD ATPase family protein [Capsulimonas corticalis]BDI31287.1 N-acetylmuramic acid/N-acetylglucosamine kinase [Capsulimonas corticalis]